MKRVAKLLLVNNDNEYLMLYRSNHPSFPYDPDLPGGTIENSEEPRQALIRELSEETGITYTAKLDMLCESNAYDTGYTYYLYRAKYKSKPDVNISWEHDRYEWLNLDDFINEAGTAADKYMRMVYDYLSRNSPRPTD